MEETMHAWVRDGGRLAWRELATPLIVHDDDVRVRVVLAGICRTDVAAARGQLSIADMRVLGHEAAGVVDAVGPDVRHVKVGDRVALQPLLGCGACASCDAKLACARGRMLGVDVDGVFAEAVVVPARAVLAVPHGMSWRRAAYVEPVAAALAVRRVPLAADARVTIVGGGRIATLTRRVLEVTGGARLVQPVQHDPGDGAIDVAIETSGAPEGLLEAMRRVRPGGLVVLKSRPAQPVPFDVAMAVRRELRFCSVAYSTFADALALLESDRFFVDDLLGAVHPLTSFGDLLDESDERKTFVAQEPAACVA